jgi:hypothetical protein
MSDLSQRAGSDISSVKGQCMTDTQNEYDRTQKRTDEEAANKHRNKFTAGSIFLRDHMRDSFLAGCAHARTSLLPALQAARADLECYAEASKGGAPSPYAQETLRVLELINAAIADTQIRYENTQTSK